MKTLFLDTETTGLHPPKDKVVEVAIADLEGHVVLNTLGSGLINRDRRLQ